jgi:ATP/maltotriose-dependent transcriptional regulator MalT
MASREPMLDTLARALVNGLAAEFPGDALAFSLDETKRWLRAHKHPVAGAQALHERTRGWAAAIALQAGRRAVSPEAIGTAGDAPTPVDRLPQREDLLRAR